MLAEIFSIVKSLLGGFSTNLINLVFALFIFLFGFIFGRMVERFLLKFFKEIELNIFIKKTTGARINADHLISSMLSYIIYFLAIVAALDYIGVANIVLYFIAAAIIIVLLISFFLAIRDFLPNFIAGMYLYSRLHIEVGSKIEVQDIKGEVVNIDLFQVKIKTKKGDEFFIPNVVVSNSAVKIK